MEDQTGRAPWYVTLLQEISKTELTDSMAQI